VAKLKTAAAVLALMNTVAHSQTTVDHWIVLCSKRGSESELASCRSYARGVADAVIFTRQLHPETDKHLHSGRDHRKGFGRSDSPLCTGATSNLTTTRGRYFAVQCTPRGVSLSHKVGMRNVNWRSLRVQSAELTLARAAAHRGALHATNLRFALVAPHRRVMSTMEIHPPWQIQARMKSSIGADAGEAEDR
jgi:hypothetical protein